MMKYVKWMIIFLVAILFQGTVIDLISIKGIHPEIVLLLLVLATVHMNRTEAILFAFVVGLLQDFLTGGIPGISSLCKTISVLVAFNLQRQKWYQFSFIRFLLIYLVVYFVHEAIYFTIFLFGTDLQSGMILINYIIPSVLYGMVMAVLLLLVIPEEYFKIENNH